MLVGRMSKPSAALLIAFRRLCLGVLEQVLKIGTIADRVQVGVGLESVEIERSSVNDSSQHFDNSTSVSIATELIGLAQLGRIDRASHTVLDTDQRDRKSKVARQTVFPMRVKVGSAFVEIDGTLERLKCFNGIPRLLEQPAETAVTLGQLSASDWRRPDAWRQAV